MKIIEILGKINLPFAYDHFAQGEAPKPPFICYLFPNSKNFSADGRAYYKKHKVHIEVYSDYKDLALEKRVEEALDFYSVFYSKDETWISEEKLYLILYTFEMED